MAPKGDAATSYEARMARLSPLIGAQKLGYNITAVSLGKRAFPPHSHLANEEMFFVLDGTGELKIGETTYPIRQGDIVALPPGADGRPRAFRFIGRQDQCLDYWEGALTGQHWQVVAKEERLRLLLELEDVENGRGR